MLAEVREALPALRAVAEERAQRQGVYRVISRRFSIYPQPLRSEAEWADWWADYYDVLEDLSLASLEAGMRAYVADPSSEFMPKPGKLRELAFSAPCRSLSRYYRATMAVKAAEEKPVLSGPRVDPGEVRELLKDFEGKILGDKPKPSLPSIAGKTAEGSSLTPEMHELMARRAGRG